MGGPKLCICQICNCGRHRCPHNLKKSVIKGPCGISEYTNKYVPYNAEPVKSCKPPHRGVDTQGEMTSETTHRVDFVPHPLSVQTSCKKEVGYEPSTVAFDGLSTYNKEYTPKEHSRATPIKPITREKFNAKFEGEPTYRADYRPWELEARKQHASAEWVPPTARFDGMPTYTSDYVGHNARPPQSCKPIHRYNPSDVPFADMTDYRDAYRKHLLTDRARPIINKECTQKATAPMEGMSTHMHDYNWKTPVPTSSCKPIQAGIHSDAPFADDTTHRTDYREWPSDRSQAQPFNPSVSYQPPKGEMSGDTTYMTDYVPHAWSRTSAVGPKQKRMFDLPPFEGTSDYRDSYRAWSVASRERGHAPDNAYRAPSVPFEGRSTSKQHYVPHWGHRPAESCKPLAQPLASDASFDDATMYRVDYTAKHLDPCPAALLNTKMSSYRFEKENEDGHMIFYRNAEECTSYCPNADKMTNGTNMSTALAVAN